MAVRKFFLTFGQSNAGPASDIATWKSARPLLNLDLSTTLSIGSYTDKFTMPGGFPGYTSLDIKGLAIGSIRYLTWYNPLATGYNTYPCTGRLATGAHNSTTIYVEQRFTAGSGSPILNITRTRTGTVHAVTAIADSGTGSVLTVTGWTDPVTKEQFTYEIRAGAELAAATQDLVLNTKFGHTIAGSLTGLRLRCTSGANAGTSKVIQSWTNSTNTVLLESAFASNVAATDTFVIEPQVGEFATFGYFLPWTPYESGATAGKVNPYPPGFNFPNHWHTPAPYNPVASGSGGTASGGISYHVGLGVRLSEFLGETIYVVASDVGGTTLSHNEWSNGGSDVVGWYDPAQQSHWSPGDSNNCFARMMAELDAAVSIMAAQGDTLECVGVFYPQGESDAGNELYANAYAHNLRRLKARVRQELKNRGMWPGAVETIPWVHPQISGPAATGYVWPYAATVNAAIAQVADEDRHSGTFSVDDIPRKSPTDPHYTGAGAVTLETRCFEAWRDIFTAATSTGEVDICNLALSHIGETGNVASISPSDGSTQATICARYYPIARDALLEMRQWGFAMKRRALSPVTSDSSTWQFAYVVPGDAMKIVAVQDAEATGDYTQAISSSFFNEPAFPLGSGQSVPQEFNIGQRADGTRILYTNLDDAVLRYVSRVTDTSRFSATFRLALSWHLASLLAGHIIKGDEGGSAARRCSQMAQFYLGQASEVDGVQHNAKPTHFAPWTAGR